MGLGDVGEPEVDSIIIPTGAYEPPRTRWVDQWLKELYADENMPDKAKDELLDQSSKIAARIPNPEDLEKGEPVKGLVIGSIQSGKTAAMLGLTAHCLDMGYNLIIVLSGITKPLRRQTAVRFNTGLLRWGERIVLEEGISFTHPKGDGYHGKLDGDDLYAMPHDYTDITAHIEEIQASLHEGKPIVVVTLKNPTSIEHLRGLISTIAITNHARKVHKLPEIEIKLLVIDDEVDEASVGGSKTAEYLPTMWDFINKEIPTKTKAAYVGFTATPQANLYERDNILYPDDFIHVLPYSGSYTNEKSDEEEEEGNPHLHPLVTYNSGVPLSGWYTGGVIYHRWLEHSGEDNFLMITPNDDVENKVDLLITMLNFTVSGAIRLIQHKGGFPDDTDEGDIVPDFGFAPSHSCLIHTSIVKARHKLTLKSIHDAIAEKVCEDVSDPTHDDIRPNHLPYMENISRNFQSWLTQHEDEWEAIYNEYQDSWNVIDRLAPDVLEGDFPTWDAVKIALARVFRNIKFRLVHDGDQGGDRLDFNRFKDSAGDYQPPQDIYTVAIGGHLLSRGLTLPGLCTTYLTNVGESMDTMIQRQRWFGYRGDHLPFCRVILPTDARNKLRKRNNEDEMLKLALAELDEAGTPPTDPIVKSTILSSGNLSNKIGNIHDIGHSGSEPWFTITQLASAEPGMAVANYERAEAVAKEIIQANHRLEEKHGWLLGLSLDGNIGYVDERWGAIQIAEFLESMQFSSWNPDNDSINRKLINERAAQLGLGKEVYRAQQKGIGAGDHEGLSTDPYEVAAYLRLWDLAWKNHKALPVNLLFNSEQEAWAPIAPPVFNLVLRSRTHGSPGKVTIEGKDIGLIKRSFEGDISEGRWGRQSYQPNSLAWDKWLDDGRLRPPVDEMKLHHREEGVPGLLFIAFIHSKFTKGEPAPATNGHQHYHKPAIGLSIPAGGPYYRTV